MSFAAIRPFFRTQMTALGYKEHKDAFNYDNIPQTLLNQTFHIDTPTGGRKGSYTNDSQPAEHDCIIRVFFKGYRYPSVAVDEAMAALDTILERILNSDNRIGTTIKNIYFTDDTIKAYAPSNDNIVLLEITFTCLMEIGT